MVKKVKQALSGCLPNNDVSWRRRGQQGHLHPERILANNHVPLGPGFQFLQGDKGNHRSSCSNQIYELQLVLMKERQEAALPWSSVTSKVMFGQLEAQLVSLTRWTSRESKWI